MAISNPIKVSNTARNREARQARDYASKDQKASFNWGSKVPRGTARRKRRELWIGVAKKVEKSVVKQIWNMDQARFIPTVTKVQMWEPTFAEFTARQQR